MRSPVTFSDYPLYNQAFFWYTYYEQTNKGGQKPPINYNGEDKQMIEMQLIRILMNEKRGEQMVVLKEKEGKRTLPIIIGIPEA